MSADRAVYLRAIIERAKGDLLGRYFIFKSAIIGAFSTSLYATQTPSAMAKRDSDARLSQIGSDAARIERRAVTQSTLELLDVFGAQNELSAALTAEAMVNFQADLVGQLSRDARVISTRFRHVQSVMAAMPEKVDAIRQQAMKQTVESQRLFIYKDAVGKLWKSHRYLETLAAQYYYRMTNDIIALEIQMAGGNIALLNRPGHKTDGIVINISDMASRDRELFHPGSQAILAEVA